MKWLKTLVVWLMLALWLPATNHCRLEALPGLLFLACGENANAAPHQDTDCDTDGCAQVEGAFYKVEEAHVDVIVPTLIPVAMVLSLESPEPLTTGLSRFPTVAAPELPATWQFFYRTALPPRAPSLVA